MFIKSTNDIVENLSYTRYTTKRYRPQFRRVPTIFAGLPGLNEPTHSPGKHVLGEISGSHPLYPNSMTLSSYLYFTHPSRLEWVKVGFFLDPTTIAIHIPIP
jgi:hypothetical protein